MDLEASMRVIRSAFCGQICVWLETTETDCCSVSLEPVLQNTVVLVNCDKTLECININPSISSNWSATNTLEKYHRNCYRLSGDYTTESPFSDMPEPEDLISIVGAIIFAITIAVLRWCCMVSSWHWFFRECSFIFTSTWWRHFHLGGTNSLSIYSGSMLIPSNFTFSCCRCERKTWKRLKEELQPRIRGI